jgi:hypothetical protein
MATYVINSNSIVADATLSGNTLRFLPSNNNDPLNLYDVSWAISHFPGSSQPFFRVEIHPGITQIGNNAFQSHVMTEFVFLEGSQLSSIIDGGLKLKASKLIDMSACTLVTTIPKFAFFDAGGADCILKLPPYLLQIDNAFARSLFRTIEIPETVTVIHPNTFDNSQVTTLLLPKGFTGPMPTFANCNSLRNVRITLQSFNARTSTPPAALEFVHFYESPWVQIRTGNVYSDDLSSLLEPGSEIPVPVTTKNITTLPTETIEGLDHIIALRMVPVISLTKHFDILTSSSVITIPPFFTSVGNDTFQSMTHVKDIIFPTASQVTSIGNNVFHDCPQLARIVFPEALLEIGETPFSDTTSSVEFLKMNKNLSVQIVSSLPENDSSLAQIVRLYPDTMDQSILESLNTKKDTSSNKDGYTELIDFYSDEDRETYVIDRSSGTSRLVKGTGLIYNGTTLTGTYRQGKLTVIQTPLELGATDDPSRYVLTQTLVEEALTAYEVLRFRHELSDLHTIVVGPGYTSLDNVSVTDTSIKSLIFPIAKTG